MTQAKDEKMGIQRASVNTISKGSIEFHNLLKALTEQYEQDLVSAALEAEEKVSRMPSLPGFEKPVGKTPPPPPHGPQPPEGLRPPQGPRQGLPMPHGINVDLHDAVDTVRCSDGNEDVTDDLRAAAGGRSSVHTRSSSKEKAMLLGETPKPKRNSAESKEGTEPTGTGNRFKDFVRSNTFDKLSALLLIINAGFIGIQVEYSFEAEEPFGIKVVDYIFCVAFIIELFTRMAGFGCKRFWCSKEDRAWNCFDFFIVSLSTFDAVISIMAQGGDSPFGNVSVLRVIRIIRITRVLRIIRVMKFFQDLRILVAAIVSTIKTASFALVLIFFTIYMFSIALTQLASEHVKMVKGTAEEYDADSDMMFFFGGILKTIFALFMTIAGGIDWKDAAVPLMEVGAHALTFFLFYVLLMTLCIMNVLTGIFCQSAIDTAASDRETVIQLQLQEKQRFIDTLQGCFNQMDVEKKGILELGDFEDHLTDETVQAVLKSLEIEVRDAITLFELLDTDGSGEVDIDEFVTGCITLRGGAKAVHMEKVSNMNKIFTSRFDDLETRIEAVRGVQMSIKADIKNQGDNLKFIPETPMGHNQRGRSPGRFSNPPF